MPTSGASPATTARARQTLMRAEVGFGDRIDAARRTERHAQANGEIHVMEIRIGIQHAPREIVLKSAADKDEVLGTLRTAIEQGTVAELEDTKGNSVLVQGSTIAYVQLDTEDAPRVGFFG